MVTRAGLSKNSKDVVVCCGMGGVTRVAARYKVAGEGLEPMSVGWQPELAGLVG